MVTIKGFLIDAAPVETHTLDSATTDHPIEDGADVTDHIRVLPDRVTIEGIVSNTPIGLAAEVRSSASQFLVESTGGEITADTPLRGLPADDALALLKQIRADREPVTVVTTIETYENMVMESLTIPQGTGDALQFRATFREIQIVKTERTSIPVSVPRGEKKTNLGTKTSETVPESKALDRQRQLNNKMNKNWGRTHNPSIGTDLL